MSCIKTYMYDMAIKQQYFSRQITPTTMLWEGRKRMAESQFKFKYKQTIKSMWGAGVGKIGGNNQKLNTYMSTLGEVRFYGSNQNLRESAEKMIKK